jgi:hypothetical protein
MKKTRSGFSLFDGKHKRFGGHIQWLSRFTGLDYLFVQFGWWKPSYDHEWYDGQHHWFSFGPLRICWGGKPFTDK